MQWICHFAFQVLTVRMTLTVVFRRDTDKSLFLSLCLFYVAYGGEMVDLSFVLSIDFT